MTEAQFTDFLTRNGWAVNANRLGNTRWLAATKECATALGQKEATIYCSASGNITAEYWSEGRNALSAVIASLDTIDASDYLDRVNAQIDGTYARRLRNHCPQCGNIF